MVKQLKNTETVSYIILSVIATFYLWIRGYYVPITFDEAATFFHFVQSGDFWFFTSLPDANNHFINSLLSFISYNIFGSSKLALRLPNLLAFSIYLYFLYRFSTFFKSGLLRWVFILSMMFSHFFVEYFALCRGYGLSMAFLLGVFYYLIKFVSEKKSSHLIWLALLLFLSELSNLSILVLAIAIIGYELLFISIGISNKKKALRQLIIVLLTQIIPLIFSSYYMFFLNEKGSLYYGDSSGFWNLTVQSLILFVTGTKSIYYSIIVIVLFLYLITIVGITVSKNGIKEILAPSYSIALLLFASIIGVILLSEIFGINHPEDRVAMYFIPLFIISIIMVSDRFIEISGKMKYVVPVFFLLFFPVHFLYSMNIRYVNGYKTEVLPEKFFNTISRDQGAVNDPPPTIGGYRMRAFCWTYQNYRNGGNHNLVDYISYPETQSDYQIVDIEENPKWLDYYNIIDTEPVLGRSLLKRKQPLELKKKNIQSINTEKKTENAFFRLATWNADSLDTDSYLIEAKVNIESQSTPFKAWFVVQLADEEGKSISYKYIPFNWLKKEWNMDILFHHTIFTGPIPENLSEIKIYIWNIEKAEYTLGRSEISLFEILSEKKKN